MSRDVREVCRAAYQERALHPWVQPGPGAGPAAPPRRGLRIVQAGRVSRTCLLIHGPRLRIQGHAAVEQLGETVWLTGVA